MSREVLLANMSASLTSEQGKLLRATVALLDQFETSWDRVMGLCEGLPSTLVHDDLATKNVRIREHRGGLDLTVMDWESAGWGNPAVDLTQFMGGVLTPDLTSYASAVRECWAFEPADLARFSAAGACFRILNGLAWTNWGFRPESITWYLSEIRWYEERLREWVDTRKSKK
jgi:aminoglycoside phosphotransferase (APT) family kinase protein